MKHFFFILSLFFSFTTFAQEDSVVTVTELKVCTDTVENALTLDSLKKHTIGLIETQMPTTIDEWSNSVMSIFDNSKWQISSFMSPKIFFIGILFFSIVLYLLCRNRNFRSHSGWKFVLKYAVFVIIALLELLYFTLDGDFAWFCNQDEVGWLMMVINCILFAGVIYNQIMCFFDLMNDCEDNFDVDIDMRLGYYSWIVGAIVTIIFAALLNDYVIYVGIALLIAQLIQFILIIIGCGKGRGFQYSIPYIFLYIVGLLVTLAIFANFFIILFIVIILYYAITIFGNDYKVKEVDAIGTDIDGKLYNLYKRGSDTYKDDFGKLWKSDGRGNVTRR